MQTPNPDQQARRHQPARLILITGLLLAVAVFLALTVAGQVGVGVLVGLMTAGLAAGVASNVHFRRTRLFTDERGRLAHLRAQSFAFGVTTLVLVALMVLAWIRNGVEHAHPYDNLLFVEVFSYLGALGWLRWRS